MMPRDADDLLRDCPELTSLTVQHGATPVEAKVARKSGRCGGSERRRSANENGRRVDDQKRERTGWNPVRRPTSTWS